MEQEDLVPAGQVPLLGDEDDEEKGPPLYSAAVVFISTLIINLLVSIVAPFFPEYADEHYGTYTAHPAVAIPQSMVRCEWLHGGYDLCDLSDRSDAGLVTSGAVGSDG